MSKKLKLIYACSEIPSKSFALMVPRDSTVEDVLKIISLRQKTEYIALFNDSSQLNNEDKIIDYWNEGKIFYASTQIKPPPKDFFIDYEKEQCIVTVNIDYSQKSILQKPKPKPKFGDGKCIFYFTGSNEEHLMNGIEVELDAAMNPDATRTKLFDVLKDAKVDMNGKQLIVYLPGGVPFIAGSLGDFFNNEKMNNVESHIYGVITRPIADKILNKSCLQICDVSDADHKLFISPLCDSSERGLCEMACLLGYLNNFGKKGNLLLKACAVLIDFPPLLTSLNRIIERNQVIYRDVVTVCSTLFTYFRIYLPKKISDDKVFEYSLRICNLISTIQYISETNPIFGPYANLLDSDSAIKNFENIEKTYNLFSFFKPIAPLSMHIATGCSIVRGKDHEYLYLMQSTTKDMKSQNKVYMIDPKTGLNEPKDVVNFAKEQFDDSANFIDPDNIEQIIMVNLDESKSMMNDLEGHVIDNDSKKDHRITIAIQYLTSFVNKIYGYHLPYIQGLVSFSNQVKVRCPLSPLVSDFEDKGLKNINVQPESTKRLLDSLIYSCDEIVRFRKGNKGEEIYRNAKSRILVISDGEDIFPEIDVYKLEDIVKELIKNYIIVDSVIINSKYENKMICALCHATGGFSFRPETVSKGLSLIEQDAFIKLYERKTLFGPLIPGDRRTIPSRLSNKIDIINAEFMNKAKDNAKFDTNIMNKELYQASTNVRLTTPCHICAKNVNAQIPNLRQRRLLKELHVAAETNDPSIANRYDADMKIYTFQASLDRWKAFLKGPEGTPYENKWWYLYVTFPERYPFQPPNFRFVSVPYHINVSSDGKICLNNIEKGYISSKHVVDIIQEIKELFLLPNLDTPVQIEIYDKLKNNPTQYEQLARESAENNAKDKFEDYFDSTIIFNEVPKEFNLELDRDEFVPPHMISQISGKKIQKERMVMASSGVYYDKEELKQHVASSKKPICIITGKYLTERLEDFTDSDSI